MVTLQKQVYGGECIARLSDGRTAFVPLGIPGEQVEIEITEDKDRFVRGRIVNTLVPSPDRVPPPCPYFGVCGGCHYQHLSYAQQLEIKTEVVLDQLRRIGKLTDIPFSGITPSPNSLHYRNQVQFHPTRAEKAQAPLHLGYKMASSDKVLPIKKCLLIPDELNDLLPQIELEPETGIARLSMRIDSNDEIMLVFDGESEEPPELSIELPVSSTYLSPDGRSLNLGGNDALVFHVLGKEFLVSPESFFQVNLLVADEMVSHVLTFIEEQENLSILELYSGVGLFTRFLAPHANQLTAIESSPSACFDFANNLDEFENISLYEGAVEAILPGIVEQIKPIDLVVLDPPRAGLNAKARQALVDLTPREIIYISCDPATLARDLKHFTEASYSLQSLHAFDMFPQTAHVETMIELHRAQRVIT